MLSLRGGLFLRRDNMQEKEAMNRLLETLIESVQATNIKLQGLEAWREHDAHEIERVLSLPKNNKEATSLLRRVVI